MAGVEVISALALLILFAAGTPAAADTVVPGEAGCADIPVMRFRSLSEEDPALGERAAEPNGTYSIRAPAAWRPEAGKIPKSFSKQSLKHRSYFRDPKLGDFLDIGVLQGTPAGLTSGDLTMLKEAYAAGIRKSAKVDIVGTDVFRFKNVCAVQILSRKSRLVYLQLMIFTRPGEVVQLTYGLAQERYHQQARAIEASIASFEWNP